MLPATASPRSSRPGSCAGRRAPPGRRSVTRCSAPSRDHDSCRHLHHCPPHISASLSSSSEAPATSSGSHSTSELSSRGHLQPLWHRRAALSARHDCGSRRRKLCLLAHRSLPLACFTPAELRKNLRKGPSLFGPFLKASMVGFTLLSRSYYYLRRRSPGPGPVPARPPSGRGTGG